MPPSPPCHAVLCSNIHQAELLITRNSGCYKGHYYIERSVTTAAPVRLLLSDVTNKIFILNEQLMSEKGVQRTKINRYLKLASRYLWFQLVGVTILLLCATIRKGISNFHYAIAEEQASQRANYSLKFM